MTILNRLMHAGVRGALVLAMLVLPSGTLARQGDGREHHETRHNPDGTWTQTDTNKDGSKTETQMDKDLHKTKETEYDPNGKAITENDWKWNDKEKQDVKRKERHHAHGNIAESETEFDENGVKTIDTVWFDGYMIVDTYRAGKRIKREKIVGGAVVRTQHFDKDGNLIAGNIAPAPAAPVLTPGAAINGIVVEAPDQFAPGEPMVFRVSTITGTVVADEPVQLANSRGDTIWTKTDERGNVSASAPIVWRDLRADVLGASAIAVAATHVASRGLTLTRPRYIQPGYSVTLHGSGFTPTLPGNTVTIGDQIVPVVGATPNAIRVSVPASIAPGPTQIQVSSGGRSLAPVSCTAVSLVVEPGPGTMLRGQHISRVVRIVGTEDKMPLAIVDPQDDAAKLESGPRTSTGGKDNVLTVALTGVRQGDYSLGISFNWAGVARLNAGNTDYEKDLSNADAARRDQAGWIDSAAGESDDNVAAAKRLAAGQAGMAAQDWDEAAEARKAGDDKKAKALEAAAKAREEAAKAYGSDRNPGRGAAAAKDAKAQEDKARSGG